MGTDIKCLAQRQTTEGWETIGPAFDWRDYGLYGFFADVHNYSVSPVIAEPRGQPTDMSEADRDEVHEDLHSQSWLSLEELRAYDYDQQFEDRRQNGTTLPEGEGGWTTLREFLGEGYFDELHRLEAAGASRIVFGFSS